MFLIAAAAALAVPPVAADGQGTPIAGAWRLIRHLPIVEGPVCVARAGGEDANMDIMLNRDGEPILVAARPDWNLRGALAVGLAIDDDPVRKLEGQSVANLVLVRLSDTALVERLRRARTLAWSLPFGRFRTSVAEFGAALDAIRACQAADAKAGKPT